MSWEAAFLNGDKENLWPQELEIEKKYSFERERSTEQYPVILRPRPKYAPDVFVIDCRGARFSEILLMLYIKILGDSSLNPDRVMSSCIDREQFSMQKDVIFIYIKKNSRSSQWKGQNAFTEELHGTGSPYLRPIRQIGFPLHEEMRISDWYLATAIQHCLERIVLHLRLVITGHSVRDRQSAKWRKVRKAVRSKQSSLCSVNSVGSVLQGCATF